MIPINKDILKWFEPLPCSFLGPKSDFIVYVIIELIEASYCFNHFSSEENGFLEHFFNACIEVWESYSALLVFFMGVDEKD